MKERVLVCVAQDGNVFYPWVREESIAFAHWWGQLLSIHPWNVLLRLRLHVGSDETMHRALFLRGLRKALKEYDKVIFFDSQPYRRNLLFASLFRRKHHAKTFVFYWNPVERSMEKQNDYKLYIKKLKKFHTVYSFQPSDCETYGLQFNSTMYAQPPKELMIPLHNIYDVVFLGKPKDRLEQLRTVHAQCLALGLCTQFWVVKVSYAPHDLVDIPDDAQDGWQITNAYVDYADMVIHLTNQATTGCGV